MVDETTYDAGFVPGGLAIRRHDRRGDSPSEKPSFELIDDVMAPRARFASDLLASRNVLAQLINDQKCPNTATVALVDALWVTISQQRTRWRCCLPKRAKPSRRASNRTVPDERSTRRGRLEIDYQGGTPLSMNPPVRPPAHLAEGACAADRGTSERRRHEGLASLGGRSVRDGRETGWRSSNGASSFRRGESPRC